jgi:hypothetical protein
MRSFRRAGRLTLGVAMVSIAVAGAGCATLQHREPPCEFVVYNRTQHPLEIHLLRARSTTPVGALNPGELLTHSVSCAENRVWIRGITIPAQVGAPVDFGFVHGWADLVQGEKASVALHWP